MALVVGPQPRSTIRRKRDQVSIVIPVRRDGFRILLSLIWFSIWSVIEVGLWLTLSGWDLPWAGALIPASATIWAFTLAFTCAGGFLLWRLLWYLKGKELFHIRGNGLEARRSVGRFGFTRRFDFEKIRNLRARRLRYKLVYPSWGRRFIGQDDCEIAFDYEGRSHRFGRGLDRGEANRLVEVIRDAIQERLLR